MSVRLWLVDLDMVVLVSAERSAVVRNRLDGWSRMPDVMLEDPFADRIVKYAMAYATPALIATDPDVSAPKVIDNGTFSLLQLEGRYLGVTCEHVLARYYELRAEGVVLQAGDVILDVDSCLLDSSVHHDLAVLDLSRYVGHVRQLQPERFVTPSRWPPEDIEAGNALSFGGYPREWRAERGAGAVMLRSLGAHEPALSVAPEKITTQFSVDESKVVAHEECKFSKVGGMSGGPVFAWRPGPVLYADLVGIIIDYWSELDVLQIRKLNVIAGDGSILHFGA